MSRLLLLVLGGAVAGAPAVPSPAGSTAAESKSPSDSPAPSPAGAAVPPTLLVPASPPVGFTAGRILYGAGVARLASPPAGPWAAADPHIACEIMAGQLLMASWTVAGTAAEWPVVLPGAVSCHNGPVRVDFRVAFGPGRQDAWPHQNGQMVVPHNGVDPIDVFWDIAGDVTHAEPEPPTPGFGCAVTDTGNLRVHLGGEVAAGPVGCRLDLRDGTTRTDEVLVLRYSEG